MADGSVHDDAHHADTDHIDKDVDLFEALLVKKIGDSLGEDSPLQAADVLLFIVQDSSLQPVFSFLPPIVSPPFRLKPPLRGPPS